MKRLPYMTLTDAYFPQWMEAIKVVEAMDFDILVPGHGPMGTKQDAADHRAYLEELYDRGAGRRARRPEPRGDAGEHHHGRL